MFKKKISRKHIKCYNMSTNYSNQSFTQQNPSCENWAANSTVKISLMVVLSIICFLSLVGNTFIIITVYKRPELKKTINYFIANMALSDFVFPLTAIPVSLAELWSSSWQWPIGGTAGLILCKLKNYVMAVSLTVSIESLVWIALDRFVAVVWPMKFRRITSRFRCFAIASTWIVALTVNSPDLYLSELLKENENIRCSEDKTSLLFLVISYVRFAVLCIIPMVLITILYSAIAVTLRKQDKMLQSTTVRNRNDHKKRLVIKMSLWVVGLFYLFFLPFATGLILWQTPISKWCSYNHVFLLSSFGLPVSSTTNPIICFAFVESFRRGLREVFKLPQRKRLKTNAIKATDNGGVTLGKINVLQEMREPEFDIQP